MSCKFFGKVFTANACRWSKQKCDTNPRNLFFRTTANPNWFTSTAGADATNGIFIQSIFQEILFYEIEYLQCFRDNFIDSQNKMRSKTSSYLTYWTTAISRIQWATPPNSSSFNNSFTEHALILSNTCSKISWLTATIQFLMISWNVGTCTTTFSSSFPRMTSKTSRVQDFTNSSVIVCVFSFLFSPSIVNVIGCFRERLSNLGKSQLWKSSLTIETYLLCFECFPVVFNLCTTVYLKKKILRF